MPSKLSTSNLQLAPCFYNSSELSQECYDSIQAIQVECAVTRIQSSLQLQFTIYIPSVIADKIQWQSFSAEDSTFSDYFWQDYLWQDSCLECFIGKTGVDEYVEINASPAGNYAVYHFEDYRTPDSMPPRPLQTTTNKQMKKGQIQWRPQANPIHDENKQDGHYQRIFSFALSQLPTRLANFNLIHPCVILYFDHIPLFFAHQHADPADFHQQAFWQKF